MKFISSASASLGFLLCASAYGQKSDLSPFKQRQDIISSAAGLMESRGQPVVLPENLMNPFVGRVEAPATDAADASTVSMVEALAGVDLLARLAAQIPVSGTASLDGEALLLLGQKRLKAGDAVRISFEGKSYELTITYIGSTSFTVSKGGLSHTRPTRLLR
jgi:hypothetical protein